MVSSLRNKRAGPFGAAALQGRGDRGRKWRARLGGTVLGAHGRVLWDVTAASHYFADLSGARARQGRWMMIFCYPHYPPGISEANVVVDCGHSYCFGFGRSRWGCPLCFFGTGLPNGRAAFSTVDRGVIEREQSSSLSSIWAVMMNSNSNSNSYSHARQLIELELVLTRTRTNSQHALPEEVNSNSNQLETFGLGSG